MWRKACQGEYDVIIAIYLTIFNTKKKTVSFKLKAKFKTSSKYLNKRAYEIYCNK